MTKVEEVARAICAANGHTPETPMFVGQFPIGAKGYWVAGEPPRPTLGLAATVRESVPAWTLYIRDAQAAIEAMRMPSEAMNQAAWAMCGDNAPWDRAWAAMIDAALKEPTEP